MNNITLTCVMGGDPKKFDLNLVNHFIKHYRDMGIEKFLIAVNDSVEENTTECVEILKGLGVEPVVWIGDFSEFDKTDVLHQLQLKVKTEWTFVVDADEFVQITDLKSLLKKCNDNDYIGVRGNFIDRTAESGLLEPVVPDKPIWEQFPKETNVIKMLGGITDKSFIFKTECALSSYGNHYLYKRDVTKFWGKSGRISDKKFYPLHLNVYHFKWTSTCENRLKTRLISFSKDSRHTWIGEIHAITVCIAGGNLKFDKLDMSKRAKKINLKDYGYVPGDERWHLIEIPLSEFGNIDFEHITYFIAFGSPSQSEGDPNEKYKAGSEYFLNDITWVPSDE